MSSRALAFQQLVDVLEKQVQARRNALLLLIGQAGWGKTTLVNQLLHQLHAEVSQSPSYAFHLRSIGSGLIADHWDLDRVTGAEDLESTGFTDWFSQFQRDSRGRHFSDQNARPNLQESQTTQVAFIEWPGRLIESGLILDWTDLVDSSFGLLVVELKGPPNYEFEFRLL